MNEATRNAIGKRTFDLLLAAVMLIPLLPLMLIVAAMIKLVSRGPVLYWSKRVGRNNSIFLMPKFRTMRIDTPQVATHLLTDADRWMIPGGRLLRSSSLDELPQLWSILRGDMSFVGPRPALFNQDDLVAMRTAQGVHALTPGLTGWAQVNGRDELPIPVKVRFDRYYFERRSLRLDSWILVLTAVKVFRREGVAQAGEETFAKRADSMPEKASLPISNVEVQASEAKSDRRRAA